MMCTEMTLFKCILVREDDDEYKFLHSVKMDFLTRCHRTKQHIDPHYEHNFMYIANC